MLDERSVAYTQILEILKRVDPKLVEKIPSELIEYFKANSANEYDFVYDEQKELNEQEISNKTRALLAILDLNYWCNSEEEKENLIQQYRKNKELYNEIIQIGFDSERIFNKADNMQIVEQNEVETAETTQLVEYKESFLKRIINRILNFFRITK